MQPQVELIDVLQEWKTNHYKELIASGAVPARPGVLRLMDEARAAGLKVAVCSASTKEAAVFVVASMLGEDRFGALDCFLAGKDVAKLKPDPLIYNTAAEMLGVENSECVVVEDSMVGLTAALAANMRCYITYAPPARGIDVGRGAVSPALTGPPFNPLTLCTSQVHLHRRQRGVRGRRVRHRGLWRRAAACDRGGHDQRRREGERRPHREGVKAW